MNIEGIINAWRDGEYCARLDGAAREVLPASPIGEIDLSDTDLEQIAGGDAEAITSVVCFSIGVLSVLCNSILRGGTCANDTTGCCQGAS